MQNNKAVALLKEIEKGFSQAEVRGVARLEKGNLSISIINLQIATDCEYYVFYDGCAFLLKSPSGGDFTLEHGLKNDCGISLLKKRGDEITTVAHGKFSQNGKDEEEILLDAKKFFKIESLSGEKALPIFQAQEYDDEALATENYYGFDIENEEGGEEFEDLFDSASNDGGEPFGNREKEEKREKGDSCENAISEDDGQNDGGQNDYYFKIKSRLNDLFKDFPPQTQLSNMVKNSRWAKIESGEKHYVVGVVYERGLAKYICYGLPGNFLKEPESLNGYSSFIPLSPFDVKGSGYWVMFQDAENGKRIAKG
ncbi:MAG: hypothetical protein IJY84_05390 [Clostridia bacterium]|nr:hypothetical protein [Clostridia bacterium]